MSLRGSKEHSHRSTGDKRTLADTEDDRQRKNSLIPDEYLPDKPRASFTIGGSEDSDSSVLTSYEYNSVSHVPRMSPIPSKSHELSSEDYSRMNNTLTKEGASSSRPKMASSSLTAPVECPQKLGFISSSSSTRSRAASPSRDVASYSSRRIGDDDGTGGDQETVQLIGTSGQLSCFTARQWGIFGVFAFVEFFCAMVISLQAPFYPAEAESKGATASEYGFVFGVFELTVFLVSPIYGSQIHKIGPKLVFNLGIFTTATCAILFGFLDRIDDRTTFVSLSIVTRIVEALGEAGFVTASFTIIACEFPSSVATTFATMETFYGIGLICGPMTGGFLYQIGGFSLPFIVVGALLFSSAVVTHFLLPKTRRMRSISEGPAGADGNKCTSGLNIFKVLRIPTIALAAFSIFTASASLGYLNATLEPHIRQFNLTPFTTGTLFIISGGCYALTAPIWGWMCDRFTQLKYFTLIGSVCIIVGFGLIGPIPYVPLETSLWGVIVGQIIQGIGLGAVLVSAFIQALRDAVKYGFPDDLMTYGVISSIWTSMFALGSFVGPTLSGILFDNVGFRVGTLSVLALQLIVITLVIIFLFTQDSPSTPLEEKDLLLPEGSPYTKRTSQVAIRLNPEDPSEDSTDTHLLHKPSGSSYGAI